MTNGRHGGKDFSDNGRILVGFPRRRGTCCTRKLSIYLPTVSNLFEVGKISINIHDLFEDTTFVIVFYLLELGTFNLFDRNAEHFFFSFLQVRWYIIDFNEAANTCAC